MPGKGRRVASRQAELGKRRRRQGRVAGRVVIGNSEAEAVTSAESSVVTEGLESATVAKRTESPGQPRSTSSQSQHGSAQHGSAQHGPARARLDRPAAYNYVYPELRRIMIMSGVLLAALIGISVAVSYLI